MSFFGKRSIEKKRRFFILPQVRSTNVTTKLRLSYYLHPGDVVEKGCFFITPKSFVKEMDMEDLEDDGAAAAYGMRMYPSQNADPVNLWADSWEERELWKTAITEGISLLTQKERVLRRDMRKKKTQHKRGADVSERSTATSSSVSSASPSRRRSRSDLNNFQQHTQQHTQQHLSSGSSETSIRRRRRGASDILIGKGHQKVR